MPTVSKGYFAMESVAERLKKVNEMVQTRRARHAEVNETEKKRLDEQREAQAKAAFAKQVDESATFSENELRLWRSLGVSFPEIAKMATPAQFVKRFGRKLFSKHADHLASLVERGGRAAPPDTIDHNLATRMRDLIVEMLKLLVATWDCELTPTSVLRNMDKAAVAVDACAPGYIKAGTFWFAAKHAKRQN